MDALTWERTERHFREQGNRSTYGGNVIPDHYLRKMGLRGSSGPEPDVPVGIANFLETI